MLKPSNKKKKNSKKRDVLGENQRYEPLEIAAEENEDGTVSFSSPHHSQPSMTRWKGAFFISTILLVPLLVYYIFDKSGLVIVIDKRPDAIGTDDDAPLSFTESSPPIITGIQEPKHHSNPTNVTKPGGVQWKKTHSMGKRNHNKKSNARQHAIKGNQKSNAGGRHPNKPVMSTKNNTGTMSSPHDDTDKDNEAKTVSHRDWPSSDLECALDLTIDFEETMTRFHQPGISFCRTSSTVSKECHVVATFVM